MNLALRDIRFNLARFTMTVVGVGFLVTASVGMLGLYRGIVADALLVIEKIGADLWVVQGGRAGPFAESSAISARMDGRVEALPGVEEVRRYLQSSQQFEFRGRSLRATVTGLDYPKDVGGWLPLVRGRLLGSGHFEAIADTSLGLSLGDRIRLGRDDFSIVGLTAGMVDIQGDSLLFVSVNDATSIAQRRTSEEVLLARAGSGIAAASEQSGSRGFVQDNKIAAVLAKLSPAADARQIEATIEGWGDANVLSRQDQHDLLLNHRLWRLRLQILAFTVVLLMVMAIVISLIVYTMTIEKLHQIAMLKLIGARNSVIVAMIAQQAGFVGAGGFGLGVAMAFIVFPAFPRRIVIESADLALLLTSIILISGFASCLASGAL